MGNALQKGKGPSRGRKGEGEVEGTLFYSLHLPKNLAERPTSDSGVLQLAASARDWLGGNPLLMTNFQLEISCFEAAARTGI